MAASANRRRANSVSQILRTAELCIAQRIWALRAFVSGNRIAVVKAIKTALRPFAAAIVLAHSATARAQAYAGDPAGSGPIVGAIRWIQGTLLGTVATVVAVIAVASIGFMMLTGRMNWRYGATVILGCFILFGAASIVAGIQSSASVGY
jgi:type IV secretion system protein VirB2